LGNQIFLIYIFQATTLIEGPHGARMIHTGPADTTDDKVPANETESLDIDVEGR